MRYCGAHSVPHRLSLSQTSAATPILGFGGPATYWRLG